MSEYLEKLKDPRWQQLRLKIFERDDWACVMCGSKDKTLHVHHTYYKNKADPWDYDLETIVTLCNECHLYQHQTLPSVKEELFEFISKSGNWDSDGLDYIKWFLNENLPKRGKK